MREKTKGFVSNYYSESRGELLTALNNSFHGGYTVMDFDLLEYGIEGKDNLMTVNLNELVKYKKELLDGKQVDMYFEWVLNEEGSEYAEVNFIEAKVGKVG